MGFDSNGVLLVVVVVIMTDYEHNVVMFFCIL